MQHNYTTTDIDELARIAEHENNTLALHVIDIDTDDKQDTIDEMIGDTAQHFASEIDDKLTDYINSYYLNPESDYFDFLYEFAPDQLTYDDSQLKGFYDGSDTELSFEELQDKILFSLDYYCEVDITHSYAASRGVSIAGASIGEVEEQIEMVTDDIPHIFTSDSNIQEQFGNQVMEMITAVNVHDKSDCIYIDMSDTFASLVLRADRIDELLASDD